MLARRFTMICLLTTVFGMMFANLVAHADRSPFADNQSQMLRCSVLFKVQC